MKNNKDGFSRRSLLGSMAATGVFFGFTHLLEGCGGSGGNSVTTTTVTNSRPNLNDYLNYFLCLEYLEAEYFLRASTGSGLAATLTGVNGSTVIGGAKVPFLTSLYASAASEIAQQEVGQVTSLRNTLFAAAVQEPPINFTSAFSKIGSAAGLGINFNPFSDEGDFLLGAFFIEDIVANAFLNSVGLDSSLLAPITSVESYHSGLIRTLIYEAGGTLLSKANALAKYRSTLSQSGNPITSGTSIFLTDSGGAISAARVLDTFYLNTATVPGGFFPSGLNGFIK
jgi:hypothetical protein